ncbi:hypothetical protein TA3x_000686 [Tundrisphaera sp. TA3]|uniref:hypothetical protein n=1 Tax=Tundrisphaera sp. TA3 TaxID=3435775 RepID=UPI003EBE5839
MSFAPPEGINPFEAPRAGIKAVPVEGVGTDAELTRRAHLGHEAAVGAIVILLALGAFLAGLGSVVFLLKAFGVIGIDQGRFAAGLFGGGLLAVFALYSTLAYGLVQLHAWARLALVVLTTLATLWNLGELVYLSFANPQLLTAPILTGKGIALLVEGYILYHMLIGPGGRVVFSKAYKDVIAQTPHIQPKPNPVAGIFLALITGMMVLGLIWASINLRF